MYEKIVFIFSSRRVFLIQRYTIRNMTHFFQMQLAWRFWNESNYDFFLDKSQPSQYYSWLIVHFHLFFFFVNTKEELQVLRSANTATLNARSLSNLMKFMLFIKNRLEKKCNMMRWSTKNQDIGLQRSIWRRELTLTTFRLRRAHENIYIQMVHTRARSVWKRKTCTDRSR